MNRKTLIGLVVAAIVALALAIAVGHFNQPARSGDAAASDYLVPGLRDHVNDVGKIVVKGAGDKTLATLERGDKGWTLAEKGRYAVDSGKLRDLLLKLADARLVEQKTANKDKYAALGVQDVADASAKGVLVELSGLAQPVGVIIGDANPHGGSYVRRAGDAQSWLTTATLSVDKEPANWLHKDIAAIPSSRIASVTLTHADGSTVKIAKAAESDANFTLADVPKGREAGDAFTINGIAGALDGLRFDDVLPAKDAAPDANPLKARFETFDGIVVDVTAWEYGGKHRATFVASLDAAQADKGIAAAQAKVKAEYEKAVADAKSDADKKDGEKKDGEKKDDVPIKPLAETDPAKDHDNRRAELDKQIADLNARFDGWTFVLPAYKYANLDKSMADLLKPVESKAADTKAKPEAKKAAAKPAGKG